MAPLVSAQDFDKNRPQLLQFQGSLACDETLGPTERLKRTLADGACEDAVVMPTETKEHHALSLLETMSGIEEEIIVCTHHYVLEISTVQQK